MISFKKIIKVYRVKNWLYYLGFVILGCSIRQNIHLGFSSILISPFLLAYSYSLNDYWDNKYGKKEFLLPLILSMVLFPLLNILQMIIVLTFLIIVTIYSAEPLRLKKIPIVVTLLNGIGFSLLFLLGYWSYFGAGFPLMFFILLLLLNCAAQLIHERTHIKEDRREKIYTTAMLCIKKLKFIISLLLGFAFLTAFWLFIFKQVNLLFLVSTAIFVVTSIYKTYTNGVNIKLRAFFRNGGIIVGVLWLISFWL